MRKNHSIKVYTDGKLLSPELRATLERNNFSVSVVDNGNDYKDAFSDVDADMIIHDFKSEIEDPSAVIPEIMRKSNTEIPQIFIFPNISSELKQIFKTEYPHADYFVKPLKYQDLMNRINVHFEKDLAKKIKDVSTNLENLHADDQVEIKSIIENFPLGVIFVLDEALCFKAVFGSEDKLFGLDKNDLLGKPLKDLFPKKNSEYLIGQYRQVWEGKRVEFECTIGNDSYLVYAAPIYSKENKIKKIISVVQYISGSNFDRFEAQENKELYKTIFEQSSDPILILEEDIFVECNDATVEFLGYDNKEELGGKTPFDLSPEFQPDGQPSKDKALKIISDTLKIGKARFEWVHQKKNGENVWCDVSLTKIKTKQKDRLYTIWRDISESKRAQAALNDSEKKYRSIFENSVVGFFRSTPDGKYADVNSAFSTIFGFDSPEEMILEVKDISELYVQKTCRKKIVEALSSKGIIENFEAESFHKSGNTIWISINAKLIKDDSGNKFFEGTVQDITQRKMTERSLKESNAHVQAIVESPKDILIFSADKELRYTLLNNQYKKAIEKLWNVKVQIGDRIPDSIHNPELKKKIVGSCRRVLEGESFDEIRKLPDYDIYYHYFWSPIKIEKGEVNGVTCIAIDMTSQKRIEDKLNKNMEELERFNNLMVGREMKMIELKNEINQLREVSGLAKKYSISK